MHYYQFNIGDYTSSTAHLEPMEDLIYRRLLDIYYSNEKPIKNDIESISRLIRMRSHSDCIASVLQEFFSLEDDGCWHCKRADIEIFKFTEISKKASVSAKKRWEKHKKKQKDGSNDAKAMRSHSEGNAKQETRTIKHKPTNNNNSGLWITPKTPANKKENLERLAQDIIIELSRIGNIDDLKKSTVDKLVYWYDEDLLRRGLSVLIHDYKEMGKIRTNTVKTYMHVMHGIAHEQGLTWILDCGKDCKYLKWNVV